MSALKQNKTCEQLHSESKSGMRRPVTYLEKVPISQYDQIKYDGDYDQYDIIDFDQNAKNLMSKSISKDNGS